MEKFEDKIKELESIVAELESGETDLDSSIKKYTKAIKLVKEAGCDVAVAGSYVFKAQDRKAAVDSLLWLSEYMEQDNLSCL